METILQLLPKFALAYLLENSTTSKLPRFKPVHKFFFQIFIACILLSGSVAMAQKTWNGNISTTSEDLALDFGASSTGIAAGPEAFAAAVFTGLTASQSICLGTASITLSGKVSDGGTIYAANGSTVPITIGTVTQNAIIAGGVGQFTISFNTSSIPAGTHTIIYAFPGDINLTAAVPNNSSTSLTVSSPPTVGTVSAAQAICSGSSPGNISVTTASGVIQWQRADDSAFTTNLIPVGSNSVTLTTAQIGTLTATKYFRALVTNGTVCPAATSATVTVTVTPAIAGNTNGSDISICTNTTTTLTGGTVTGGNGSYTYSWESSTALAGTYTAAAGTNNTATYTTANPIGSNVYFRRTVTSGACTSTATGFHVTVNSAAAVGAVTGTQTICSGDSPSTDITVASATGTIQWERADNSAFTTNLISVGAVDAMTLTSAVIGTLTTNKYFRAKVTSGVCAPAYSATITVTVSPAAAVGAVSGNQTICGGTTPTTNITVAGVTGTIQWQCADDAAFTINTANIGTGAATLTPGDIGILIATKYFRAKVTSGVCTINSTNVIVTVNTAAEANAGPNRVMCVNGSITLAGNIGAATTSNWTAPNGTFSLPSSLTSNYTTSISGPVTLTLTTSDPDGAGPCVAVTSTTTVTVNPGPTTTDVSICTGGTGSLTSSTVCPPGSPITTDFKDATSFATNTGVGTTDWTNPGNIVSNNNSYATVNLSDVTQSRYLIGSNYAFNIPAGAVIVGIQANVGRFSSLFFGFFNRIRDYEVKLIKGGTIQPTNRAKTTTNWTGSEVASSYGGTGDLWGTTWTAADINASNFGLAFSVQNNTAFGIPYTASVDYMQIAVTYTIAGSTNWYTAISGGTFIGSGNSFNPVGVPSSGLPNTSSPGTTIFYGESTCAPGCRTATDFEIKASPTLTLGANPSLCSGITSANLTYSATGSPNQYSIVYNAAAHTAGFVDVTNAALPPTPIILTIPSAAAAATYTGTLTVTNSITACPSASSTFSVTVNASPTITLGANPSVCRGTTSANLTYSGTAGNPNQYSIVYSAAAHTAGFVDVTNAALTTTPIVLIVPSAAAAATYTGILTITNGITGCGSGSNAISVTVTATPTITLGANPSLCKGITSANLTYSATTGSPNRYSIVYNAAAHTAGFVDVINAVLPATPIIIIVPAAAATATYTGTLTAINNTSGCFSTDTAISVTVNALPTVVLTSDDVDNILCLTTKPIFTATPTPAGSYSYDFRVAGSSVQNTTANTYQVTTASSVANKVIDVIVTDSSTSCKATSTGITNTMGTPTIGFTSSAAPSNTFCSGASVTFTATGGTNYNFRVAGSTVQNSASPTYTTTTLTNGQVVNVTVTNTAGCIGSNTGITNIVNALPAMPTLGTLTQPNCTILTGSVVLNGLPSGNWTINPGNISGSGASTTISGLLAGTTNFTVTNALGCTSLQSPIVISGGGSKTWLGTSSSDWFTDSNWLPAGVPDLNSCVLVPSNIVTVYVSGTNKTAFANTLTIQSGGKLEVTSGNNLVVTNSVNVDLGGTLILQDSTNLIQVNNSTNTGTINSIRNTAPVVLNDYNYWSSPTSGSQTLLNFSPNSNPKYFLSYSNGWQYLNASNTVFNKGVGYAILSPKGISAPTSIKFQFDGTPNNGTITVPIAFDSSTSFSSKLIGNPYPSALDADKFIMANRTGSGTPNQTISGTLYFWTHNQPLSAGTYPQSDYAVYNLTGGVGTGIGTTNTTGTGNPAKPTRWIASGQGFLVETKATGNVTYSNDMRIIDINYLNSNFYKNTNTTNAKNDLEKNRIWINLTKDNSFFSQILIGYIETATNDYDPGFDGPYLSSSPNAIYSLIGNSKYTIQGRALPFTDSDFVQLGYKTEVEGNLTISIDSMDGLFLGDQGIFVEDKLLNVIRNIKLAPYSFATTAGTFDDRFVLRYNDSNLGLNKPGKISDNIQISSKNQQIRVKSTIENIEKIFVYDMLGRTVYKNSEIDSKEALISDLKTQQVLIIKVVLKNGQIVNKKLVNQ